MQVDLVRAEAQRRPLVGAEHLVRHAERARVEGNGALDRCDRQHQVIEADDFHDGIPPCCDMPPDSVGGTALLRN